MEQKRVLIVDDNVDAAESLKALLTFKGHEARAVYNGVEALDAARRFLPDVVLLDLAMPELDGCQVASVLKQDVLFAGTLLVALTGWCDDRHRKAAKDAGCDVHLVKPVEGEVLFALLAGAKARKGGL